MFLAIQAHSFGAVRFFVCATSTGIVVPHDPAVYWFAACATNVLARLSSVVQHQVAITADEQGLYKLASKVAAAGRIVDTLGDQGGEVLVAQGQLAEQNPIPQDKENDIP